MTSAIRSDLESMKTLKYELSEMLNTYKYGLDDIFSKVTTVKQMFEYNHGSYPIEHIKTRLKTPESILNKMLRKGYPLSLKTIHHYIRDIAGIRITCSFVSDIYKISNLLQQQQGIHVVETKDYIQKPKPNGYQSLHLILKYPAYESDKIEHIYVEIQIRTIAMDFWACLEHKIYYKYDGDVPRKLVQDLKEAADTVASLDKKMEQIHNDVMQLKNVADEDEEDIHERQNHLRMSLPINFLSLNSS
jgi:putative GTP pyrophosphokinase